MGYILFIFIHIMIINNGRDILGEFNNASAPTSACQCDHYIVERYRVLDHLKWLSPVTNKSNPPMVGNHSETLPTFSLYFSISYIDTKIHTSSFRESNQKHCLHSPSRKPIIAFGSHLRFSGGTPIDLNRERL